LKNSNGNRWQSEPAERVKRVIDRRIINPAERRSNPAYARKIDKIMEIKDYDVVKLINEVIISNEEGNVHLKSGEIGVVVESYYENGKYLIEFTELNLENIYYLIQKENLEKVD
jgi:hypothetical protein